jgi:hypothetical protein
MIRVSLRFFANRVLKTRRMDAGDRETLQRVIFSDGVRSRIEAEILLQLARAVRPADPAWNDFVVVSIVDFAVWGSRPTGYVDAGTAEWLVAILAEGGRTALTRRIARAILAEAQDVDPRLADFARPWWRPTLSWTGWTGAPEQRVFAPA